MNDRLDQVRCLLNGEADELQRNAYDRDENVEATMRKSTLVQLSVPGAAPRYRTGRNESPSEREEGGVQTADDLEKAVYEFAHICGVASKREWASGTKKESDSNCRDESRVVRSRST